MHYGSLQAQGATHGSGWTHPCRALADATGARVARLVAHGWPRKGRVWSLTASAGDRAIARLIALSVKNFQG